MLHATLFCGLETKEGRTAVNGVCTQDTSRMETERVKQEEKTDKRIIAKEEEADTRVISTVEEETRIIPKEEDANTRIMAPPSHL